MCPHLPPQDPIYQNSTRAITYHHFKGERWPNSQGAASSEAFESVVQNWCATKKILSAPEWMKEALSKRLDSETYCITFDDNLKSQFEIALPILRKYKIRAFFFIYTSVFEGQADLTELFRHFRSSVYPDVSEFYRDFDGHLLESSEGTRVKKSLESFIAKDYLSSFSFYTDEDRRFRYIRDHILGPEKYNLQIFKLAKSKGFDLKSSEWVRKLWMNTDDIQELHAEGHIIGMHSHSHPTLFQSLTAQQQAREYQQCFDWIKKITGQAPLAMSHPCNSYNLETLAVLEKLKIKIGFRADTELQKHSHLEFPRTDQASYENHSLHQ